ncbi:MAG: tRNA (adenosine(37)-N6)-threonylcarbamoyltransferase complex ATPase subunit type 1 TsaE [Gammaproteobacteria bacterium]|nr:tRNA (adenosine(37)-N6)-threonylcarbamoyltransferase complex ATPase subunit type 1 TsaE [Gammaproteobacteria bacterium]
MITLALGDAAATERLGAALGPAWERAAPRAQSLHLLGELGAGKTTLAQGLLAALGVAGAVRSPSYSLIEIYRVDAGTIVHADFYRLRGAEELEALGWRDYCVPGTLGVIEWPQNAGPTLPPPDLRVMLEYQGAGRRACIDALTAAGAAWLKASGITADSTSI